MLTAIIIENTYSAAQDLMNSLEKYCSNEVELIGVASTFKSGIELVKNKNPDFIFLDIELDNGNTGFDLLDQIENKTFDVIFYSSFDKYAERAFRYSAIDFIIKPAVVELLIEAIERVKQRAHFKDLALRIETLKQNNSNYPGAPQLMGFHVKNGPHAIVDINRILYIKSYKDADSKSKNSDLQVVFQSEFPSNNKIFDSIIVGKNKKYFDDLLRVHSFFFNAGQSATINIKYISKIDRGNSQVIMKDNVLIDVTGGRVTELLKLFKGF